MFFNYVLGFGISTCSAAVTCDCRPAVVTCTCILATAIA